MRSVLRVETLTFFLLLLLLNPFLEDFRCLGLRDAGHCYSEIVFEVWF